MNHNINILIKPTNACNLNCKYCFNDGSRKCLLPFETFEKLINLAVKEFTDIQIVWHGGEPTLWGKDNYKKAFTLINSITKSNPKISIKQCMQSNCVHIDNDLLQLLKENNVSLGTSFDGPYNELTRGMTDKHLATIKQIHDNNMYVGAICVITNKTIDKIVETYQWFKEHKQGVNFRPIIINGEAEKYINEFKLDIDEYINKLYELFKIWIYDKECSINVEPFESLIKMTFNKHINTCCYSSCIGNWMCVEPNGDITPCNRDFDSKFIYGNVNTMNSILDIYKSEGIELLLKSAIKRREYCQNHCEYFNLCGGGCNHEAYINGDISKPDFPLCKMIKFFIPKIKEFFSQKTNPNDLNKNVLDIINNN